MQGEAKRTNRQEMNQIRQIPPNPALNHGLLVYNFGHGHDGLLLEESRSVPLVVVVLVVAVVIVGVVFAFSGNAATGEELVGVSLRLTPASLASAAANLDAVSSRVFFKALM